MRLLIFEPHVFGHFVEYVRHIMLGWREREISGELGVVVSNALIRRHPELPEFQYDGPERQVTLYPIDTDEGIEVGTMGLLEAGLWHRSILRDLVARYAPEHLLCLYFDHAQLAFAMRTRFSAPTRFSGILLRPTLYYTGLSAGERRRQLRKRFLLRLALGHSALDVIHSLDPFAVDAINRLTAHPKARAIADPIEQLPLTRSSTETREELGVERHRQMALLFGTMTSRKGVIETLRAVPSVPADAARRLALVVIGPVADHFRADLHDALSGAGDTEMQIIVRDMFVPDDEVSNLIHAADVLLMPYQRHVGSSGVLIRGAAARKPVITQDFGLVGELARRNELGLTIDCTNIQILAQALVRTSLGDIPFNPTAAADFARQHTVENFLDGVLQPFGEQPVVQSDAAGHHRQP